MIKDITKTWIAVLSIIIVFIAASIITERYLPLLEQDFDTDLITFLNYIISFMVTIGYVYIIRTPLKLEIPSLRPEIRKLNPRLIVTGMLLILATSVVLCPIVDTMPVEYMDMIDNYIQSGLWAMITAVIAAPIFEEFLFRGVIQENLIKRMGPIGGILMGALLFGVIHIIPQQIIYASATGVILGSIYYLTKSLNTVVAVHFVNNGLTYLMFLVLGSRNSPERVILGHGNLFIGVYAISLLMLILSGWYMVEKIRKDKKREVKPEEN